MMKADLLGTAVAQRRHRCMRDTALRDGLSGRIQSANDEQGSETSSGNRCAAPPSQANGVEDEWRSIRRACMAGRAICVVCDHGEIVEVLSLKGICRQQRDAKGGACSRCAGDADMA